MKNWNWFAAVVICLAGCPASYCQYGQYINVTGASVTGSIIGGAPTPTAVLKLSINRNDTPPGNPGIPVVVQSLVTVTCAGDTHLPYNSGCFVPPGATSISIGLSHNAVIDPTPITFNVAVEYDGDPGQNVTVTVLPQSVPTASETGCTRVVAGKPIDLAGGNVLIEQTDIRPLPGLGGGVGLTRTWNSKWPAEPGAIKQGMFGLNWRSSYEERIFVGSDGTLKYSAGDGCFKSFGYNNSGWIPVAPAAFKASLAAGASTWNLTLADGEQRIYDAAGGALQAIIDRNGNTTTLTYDQQGRLSMVTDPALRHLTFAYVDSSSTLVASVSTDVGHSASYTYDNSARLTQVTETDGRTVTFEYDGNSLITAVKDSQGKILEAHSYDSSGRGLSSSRAGGVEALTISYPAN